MSPTVVVDSLQTGPLDGGPLGALSFGPALQGALAAVGQVGLLALLVASGMVVGWLVGVRLARRATGGTPREREPHRQHRQE